MTVRARLTWFSLMSLSSCLAYQSDFSLGFRGLLSQRKISSSPFTSVKAYLDGRASPRLLVFCCIVVLRGPVFREDFTEASMSSSVTYSLFSNAIAPRFPPRLAEKHLGNCDQNLEPEKSTWPVLAIRCLSEDSFKFLFRAPVSERGILPDATYRIWTATDRCQKRRQVLETQRCNCLAAMLNWNEQPLPPAGSNPNGGFRWPEVTQSGRRQPCVMQCDCATSRNRKTD